MSFGLALPARSCSRRQRLAVESVPDPFFDDSACPIIGGVDLEHLVTGLPGEHVRKRGFAETRRTREEQNLGNADPRQPLDASGRRASLCCSLSLAVDPTDQEPVKAGLWSAKVMREGTGELHTHSIFNAVRPRCVAVAGTKSAVPAITSALVATVTFHFGGGIGFRRALEHAHVPFFQPEQGRAVDALR